MARPATATPTPIPAFAPELSPLDEADVEGEADGIAGEVVDEEEPVAGDDDVGDEMDDVVDDEMDDVVDEGGV
ncbi:MAG: hypothetical protein Q9219_003686 [cf. Caloplaca sp. 3 TL-2023]